MWNERYSEPGFAYGVEPNDFLVSVADRLPPEGDVLCLAEGEGRNAVWLARRGHRAHAVDLSPVGLDKAKRLAAARGVSITTEIADLVEWDLGEGRWDGVVSIFCHLAPEARRDLHRRVVRALRPGGVLILEGYAPDSLERGTGGPKTLSRLLALAELKDELSGLWFPIARQVTRGVYEGRYHMGPGVVVQIVGERPKPV